jgi:hypothetical protein
MWYISASEMKCGGTVKDNSILRGWAAIAKHLGCTVRHAQRLEKTKGLPVHRNGKLSSPFVLREEVARWLSNQEEVPHVLDILGTAGDLLPAGTEDDRVGPTERGAPQVVPLGDIPAEAEPRQGARSFSKGQRNVRTWRRPVAVAVAVLILVVAAAAFAYAWIPRGEPLRGEWSRIWNGWAGASQGVGRLDTGRFVGPGSVVRVEIVPKGLSWSGGIEIFQDETHWTFVNLSPTAHEILVWRYPSGFKSHCPLTDLVKDQPISLVAEITENSLRIRAGQAEPIEIALTPGDVAIGRLVLRMGKHADEYGPPEPGKAEFRSLSVRNAAPSGESWLMVPPAGTPPNTSHHYQVHLFNVDDQEDLFLNGKRIASAGCFQTAGPFEIGPLLKPGENTLTVRLFNRQGPSCYGVRLQKDGQTLWEEECGTAQMRAPYCQELGYRLGMVKELSYTLVIP